MGSQSNGELFLRQGLYAFAHSLDILYTYTVFSTRDYYIFMFLTQTARFQQEDGEEGHGR